MSKIDELKEKYEEVRHLSDKSEYMEILADTMLDDLEELRPYVELGETYFETLILGESDVAEDPELRNKYSANISKIKSLCQQIRSKQHV